LGKRSADSPDRKARVAAAHPAAQRRVETILQLRLFSGERRSPD
jgi:hypothetical protein